MAFGDLAVKIHNTELVLLKMDCKIQTVQKDL